MKSFIKWLIALASSFIILFTSLGYYASSQVLFFKLRDVEVIKRRETRAKRLNMKAFQNLPQDDILIPSQIRLQHQCSLRPSERHEQMDGAVPWCDGE